MNQQVAKMGVWVMQLKAVAVRRMEDDRGEISSWLILAAGLALIALFIGNEIADMARRLITDITTSQVGAP